VPLCPPQIPHDLTWDWTRATAVGSQWLIAWVMKTILYSVSVYVSWGKNVSKYN
jgi:hypothetical protein